MKKLLAAATTDAAASEVSASVAMDAVTAACRLAQVAAADAPMVNWFGPGLADVVAVRVNVSLVPSGSAKW